MAPTAAPTVAPKPTAAPTVAPTATPTAAPQPTAAPTQPPVTGETTWSESTIYNTGDTVVVNGVTYTAQWWTRGENPAKTGPWGVWKK